MFADLRIYMYVCRLQSVVVTSAIRNRVTSFLEVVIEDKSF